VEEVLVKVGQDLKPGTRILQFTGGWSHPTIMKVRWDGWRRSWSRWGRTSSLVPGYSSSQEAAHIPQ
jgi:hypothetical protein